MKALIEQHEKHATAVRTMKSNIVREKAQTNPIDEITQHNVADAAVRRRQANKQTTVNVVHHAARKVLEAKGEVDHGKPVSFPIANRLSRYRVAAQSAKFPERDVHLHHHQRRMVEYDNVVEKKKNKDNADFYPVCVFRRTVAKPFSAKPPTVKRAPPRPKTAPPSAPVITAPLSEQKSRNENGELNPLYKRFRQAILDTIVEKRIYRSDELRDLFSAALQQNQGLDRKELKKIIGEISSDLALD
eukprot:JP436027.1.p1 GENE.JP436027.1~~JP436027.1.p1  ORF type:complete len:264 (+),score=10.94 JP436027.1:60-794(+)